MAGLLSNTSYCQQSSQLRFLSLAGLLTISLVKIILIKKRRCTWEQKFGSLGEVTRNEHVNAMRKEGGASQPPEPSPRYICLTIRAICHQSRHISSPMVGSDI